MKPWFVYILSCSDNTFYTGISNNLKKRVSDHNAKKGARYTRIRTPVKLIYKEKYPSVQSAMKREREIKRMPRPAKEKLVKRISKRVKKKKKR